MLDQAEVKRIVDLYRSLGLPVQFPDWDPREIYIGMLNDKKVLNQRLRLVLPRGIGNYALIEGIGEKEIIAAIKKAQEIQ
jgi:3-dehydroquinate synthase